MSAEIDPDHKVQIDRDNFNNSHTVEANPKPATQTNQLLALYHAVVRPGLGVVGRVAGFGFRASGLD